MTPEEIRSKILAVKQVLEHIEVRGQANMKNLLTCIAYLEGMASALEQKEEEN